MVTQICSHFDTFICCAPVGASSKKCKKQCILSWCRAAATDLHASLLLCANISSHRLLCRLASRKPSFQRGLSLLKPQQQRMLSREKAAQRLQPGQLLRLRKAPAGGTELRELHCKKSRTCLISSKQGANVGKQSACRVQYSMHGCCTASLASSS